MIEWFDGFDTTISNDPDVNYDSGSDWAQLAVGRFGGYCAGGNGGNILYLKKSLQPLATRYFGYAVIWTGYYNHTTVFQWYDFTTIPVTLQAFVGCTSNGQIYFQSGSTVLGITPPFLFRLNAWYYLEAQCTVGLSSGMNIGSFEVRLGGNTILQGYGVNTQQSGNAFTDGFIIGPNNHIYVFDNDYIIDDFYVLNTLGTKNNTFLGEQKVITSDLNADYSIQFGRNSGSSNYGQLLTYDADTTYTYSDTIGQEDLFGITPLEPTLNNYNEFYYGNDITATKMTVIARKTDVGYRNIGLVINSGATTQTFPFSVTNAGYFLGITIPLLSTYESSYQIFENDPNTGSNWTQVGVNGVHIGYSVIG